MSAQVLATVENIRQMLKARMDERWADICISPITRPQQKNVNRLQMDGWTKDSPPKYYKVIWDVPPVTTNIGPLLRDMAKLLDSFLDPRCSCVPGPNGEWGGHCDFHKTVFEEAAKQGKV